MTVITDAKLAEVRKTVNLIDNAVTAVQELADREDQNFPNRPRIRELRRISRTLAHLETDLSELFS